MCNLGRGVRVAAGAIDHANLSLQRTRRVLILKQSPRWAQPLMRPARNFCQVGQLQTAHELLAQRIISAARKGDLDPARLRVAALNGLRLAKMLPPA